MLVSQGDDAFGLLVRQGIKDHIDVLFELEEVQVELLLQTGAVAVHDALPLHETSSAETLFLLKFLQKLVVHVLRRWSLYVSLSVPGLVYVRIDLLLSVVLQVRKHFASV